ncbi:MAG: DUF899 domain-containing protein [Prosthecobacter sp.]
MKTNQLVVSREEWLEARRALLAKEKAHIHANDELSRQRRAMPWVEITKPYVFDTADGRQVPLADLFDGRSQLFVYHFMFGPDWEEGCSGCSFLCDHVDGARQHFEHHDLSFVAVSRGPVEKLEAYRQRMGWKFRWVSSGHTDFNYDFNVSFPPERVKDGKIEANYAERDYTPDEEEQPGFSVFFKDDDGKIYHTYSSYSRGGEVLLTTYNFIDATPFGRMEGDNIMGWMRRHDRYENDGRGQPLASQSPCCGCKD